MGHLQKTTMLHLLPITCALCFSLVVAATYVPSWTQDVTSVMEKAEIEAKKITLPVNRYAEEGLQAAKETSGVFFSPEFQERIRSEEQRLEQDVFSDHIEPWKTKHSAVKQQVEQTRSLDNTERVYLFISSSMPDQTVQAYISVVVRAGDSNLVPVMRGWINGLTDTRASAEYFSRILQKDPGCQNTSKPCEHYKVAIKLQPALFSTYGITQVPAVIYINDKAAYQIKGDAGLDYLLERINREAQSETLNNLIQKIRDT